MEPIVCGCEVAVCNMSWQVFTPITASTERPSAQHDRDLHRSKSCVDQLPFVTVLFTIIRYLISLATFIVCSNCGIQTNFNPFVTFNIH